MSQKTNKRRFNENEAVASVKMLRVSPSKLNLVAGLIRGKDVSTALNQLAFSRKRIAQSVREVLKSAVANAENNHGLDIDALHVTEVQIGKALVMKRFRARARGRGAKILKPFSNLAIKVAQIAEVSDNVEERKAR